MEAYRIAQIGIFLEVNHDYLTFHWVIMIFSIPNGILKFDQIKGW